MCVCARRERGRFHSWAGARVTLTRRRAPLPVVSSFLMPVLLLKEVLKGKRLLFTPSFSRVSTRAVWSGGPFGGNQTCECTGDSVSNYLVLLCAMSTPALRCASLFTCLCFTRCACLLFIVATRVIATLVVYGERIERAVYLAAMLVPALSLCSPVVARPFWPRPLLPHHFFFFFFFTF